MRETFLCTSNINQSDGTNFLIFCHLIRDNAQHNNEKNE